MATMTIRNIDDELKSLLRVRAAQHGRSMEEEARRILQAALVDGMQGNTGAALVSAIRARAERSGSAGLNWSCPHELLCVSRLTLVAKRSANDRPGHQRSIRAAASAA